MNDNPFEFVVPNLDDTSRDIVEYIETARVLQILAEYMRHKGAAIHARKLGKMTIAIFNEGKCDKLYVDLPEWAKW